MEVFSGISRLGRAAVLTLCLSSCSTVGPLHKDKGHVDNIPSLLRAFVTQAGPNRTAGSPGHEKAFEFIKGQFDEIATLSKGRVIIHEFWPDIDFAKKNYQKDFDTLIKGKYPPSSPVYKKWKHFTDSALHFVEGFRGIRGRNLILEIPGRSIPTEVIYVGAHYDTINNNKKTLNFDGSSAAPGADDNASGVAALLTVAREMIAERPDRTIRFVAFDDEEIFFLGSYALAQDLNGQRPRWLRNDEQNLGLINLEMIGWSKSEVEKKNPVFKIYTRTSNWPGVEADLLLAEALKQAAALLKSKVNPTVLQNGFNRSDNWTFWLKSFPAICVSQDWENDFDENYHSSADRPEGLNYPYLKEITTILVEALTDITKGRQSKN